jgi:hypothetical protein
MRLLSAVLSTEGFATLTTVIGLENVLDRVEDFQVGWVSTAVAIPGATTCGSSARPNRRAPGAGASAGTTCRST